MTVRAKFKVQSITRSAGWSGPKSENHTIVLVPVVGGSPENDSFFAATPSGEFKLSVVKEEVGLKFELNGEYYVDFTRAS